MKGKQMRRIVSGVALRCLTFRLVGNACVFCAVVGAGGLLFGTQDRDSRQLSELLDDLRTGDVVEVKDALVALTEMGAQAAPAIPLLIERLDDDREPYGDRMGDVIGKFAEVALWQIGKPAIPALTRILSATDKKESRIRAIRLLELRGHDADQAVAALAKCVNENDLDIRLSAIHALATVAKEPRSVVPLLICMLGDKDPNIRGAAACGLGRIGGVAAAPAVPQLLAMVDDTKWRGEMYSGDCGGAKLIRIDAIEALGEIGVRDRCVVTKMASLLNDQNSDVRIAAAQAYCLLSDDVGKALTVLTSQLRNKTTAVAAARALAGVGSAAQPVTTELIRSLADSEELVRSYAVDAIAAIRPPNVIELLKRMMRDNSPIVREHTIMAFERLNDRDPCLTGLIIESLKDNEWGVRFESMKALARLGARAKAAIPRLRKMAMSGDAHERRIAQATLRSIETALNEKPKNKLHTERPPEPSSPLLDRCAG